MKKLYAFTLAEVLITLAIIGVVASLTIPTLVVQNQEKGWNTAATVFERKLEEALKVMNTQQTLAGYRTTKDFVNELSNHLKIVKVCSNNELDKCFEDKVYWGAGETELKEVEISSVKTAKNFGQKDWSIDTEVLGFQLNNGTNGLIAYNPDCRQNPYSNQITGTSCVAVLYDTSGFTKPNTSGKDLRSINVKSLGGIEYAFEINGIKFGKPFLPPALTYEECEREKIALGIGNCELNDDNWAGAVKECGGINNMPTINDMFAFGNDIYNQPLDIAGQISNANQDTVKTTSYGFPEGSFAVWVGKQKVDETSPGRYAYVFSTGKTSASFATINRNISLYWAVCVVSR